VKLQHTLATVGMIRPFAPAVHHPLASKAPAKIIKTTKKDAAARERALNKAQREADRAKAQEAKKAAEEKGRITVRASPLAMLLLKVAFEISRGFELIHPEM
jgi:hypothetical protein